MTKHILLILLLLLLMLLLVGCATTYTACDNFVETDSRNVTEEERAVIITKEDDVVLRIYNGFSRFPYAFADHYDNGFDPQYVVNFNGQSNQKYLLCHSDGTSVFLEGDDLSVPEIASSAEDFFYRGVLEWEDIFSKARASKRYKDLVIKEIYCFHSPNVPKWAWIEYSYIYYVTNHGDFFYYKSGAFETEFLFSARAFHKCALRCKELLQTTNGGYLENTYTEVYLPYYAITPVDVEHRAMYNIYWRMRLPYIIPFAILLPLAAWRMVVMVNQRKRMRSK